MTMRLRLQLIATVAWMPLLGVACEHTQGPATPQPIGVSQADELPMSEAEIDARRPLLKRSATRWALLDDAKKLAALEQAGYTERIWQRTQAKYVGREDIQPPQRIAVATNLQKDVDAYFQQHQPLIVSWSVEELICASARQFDWETAD